MKRIGILGAGVMGSQLAAVFALAGYRVFLFNHRDCEASRPSVRRWLRHGLRRYPDVTVQAEDLLGAIAFTQRLDDLRDADWLIESVIENLPIKQILFADLARLCRSDAVLASNTSSLVLSAIAKDVSDKGRVIGTHFFNPVFETDLVELIVMDETQPSVIENAEQLVHSLKKVPLVLKESCINRILFPMINEACYALEQGLFQASDIDRAFKLGAKHPMGPLALADLIGLDVVVAILESLQARLGDRYRPSPVLYDLVKKGSLGRKSGMGFFSYGKLKSFGPS